MFLAEYLAFCGQRATSLKHSDSIEEKEEARPSKSFEFPLDICTTERPCSPDSYSQIKIEKIENELEDLHHSDKIEEKEEATPSKSFESPLDICTTVSTKFIATNNFFDREPPCAPENYSQIKTEKIENELEDLHHSIDIKDELPIPEYQLDTQCKPITYWKKFYECESCNFSSTTKGGLKLHLKIHLTKYKCRICDYECTFQKSLKKHFEIHTGEQPFTCEFCEYQCRENTALKVHLRIHTGEKPYMCDICNNTFPVKARLNKHLLTHTGEKPFTCKICDFKCAQKGNLTVHYVRNHSGQELFMCQFCDHKFILIEDLKVHLETHTEKNPFQCEICDRFGKEENLKIHVKAPTDVEPFMCEIFGHTCPRRGSLKSNTGTK